MHRIIAVALLAGAVTAGKDAAAGGAPLFQAGGVLRPPDGSFAPLDAPITQTSDTFAHAVHRKLACLTCHLSTSQSMLTFQPPRGCQICHHRAPIQSNCVTCHEPSSVPRTLEVNLAIAAAAKPERNRPVGFRHERHTSLDCMACHGQPVTLAPVDSAATCRGCHANHHEAERSCAACHHTDNVTRVHTRPVRVHVACDACHAASTVALLEPTRSLCLICHGDQVDHQPERECSTCHLGAPPGEYRYRLRREARPK